MKKNQSLKSKIILFFTVLLSAFFVMQTTEVKATHFRGGILTWQQAGGNSITFSLNTQWRRNFFAGQTVGSTNNIGTFTFGDATSTTIIATVNAIDIANNISFMTWTFTKTYAAPGNYNASALNNCCRISTLLDGNNDQFYYLGTIVNVGGPPFNNSPVSSLPPIVNLPIGAASATFTIPGSDPDIDALTYRVATTTESGLVTAQPSGFSLSSSGLATMNTTTRSVGQLFAIQIMIEDGKTKSPVDFIIRMVGASAPPVFIPPTPTSGTIFNVTPPGNLVSFTIEATDPDAGQTTTLNSVAVPIGSTMTPTLPVTSPVNGTIQSTFNWTPTVAQVGSYVINFVAQDNVGIQTFSSVTINVLCPLDITVTNATGPTCPDASDGSISVSIQNASAPANLIFSWTGPGGFTSNQQNISGLASGTYNLRVDDIATGCFSLETVILTPVNPFPTISCPADFSVCIDTAPFVPSATPAGGTYSGTGISGGNFDPAAAGVGTHTITYSYTDPATGCSNSCTFTITVNALPLVGCPGNSSVCINSAPYSLLGGSPAGGTYNGTGVTGGNFDPAAAGIGVHTITYSYTDGNGCTNSCTFNITVDALPAVNAGTYPGMFISNPGILLSGSPTGGLFAGPGVIGNVFNPGMAGGGTHTISYTYTDPSTGCTNTAITTITVSIIVCPVSVTISASSNNFCSNLTLTAVPSAPGAYIYEWLHGATVVGTQPVLNLSLANPEGVYTLTLPGCATSSVNYSYDKQNSSQSYTIIALKDVDIHELNHVYGSVGSTGSDGKVKIGKKSTVPSPGFVKAKKLDIHPTAIVPNQYPGAPVTVTLPTMQVNTTPPSGSNLTVSVNGTYPNISFPGPFKDVTVKKNVIAMFTGTNFKKLTLEEGAMATFTSSVVNFEEIDIKKGKTVGSGNRTRLNFAGNTSVRIKKKVHVDEFCRINEGGHKVTFYMEDEEFHVKGQGTRIVANVYAPEGNIHVHFSGSQPVFMTGQYIGKEVKGHGKNTYWNGYDCNANNSIPPIVTRTIPSAEATDSPLQVRVFPNPSDTWFNLTALSNSKEVMTVTLYNMVGMKVQQNKTMPGQSLRLGDQLVSGTYFIEVKQGNERVTVKVIKQ